MAGDDVLRALEPLEADHGDGCGLDLTLVDAAPRKAVDLFTGSGVLLLNDAVLKGDVEPWVRHFSVELIWVEPTDNLPRLAAEHRQLVARAQALLAFGAGVEIFDQLVGRAGSDGFSQPAANTVAFLGDDVADRIHRPFVVFARAWGDLLGVGIGVLCSRNSQSTVPYFGMPGEVTGIPLR